MDAVRAIFERDIGAKLTVEDQLRLQECAGCGLNWQRSVDDLVIDEDFHVALHDVKVGDLPDNRHMSTNHLLPGLRRVQLDDRALEAIVKPRPCALAPFLSDGAAGGGVGADPSETHMACKHAGEPQKRMSAGRRLVGRARTSPSAESSAWRIP